MPNSSIHFIYFEPGREKTQIQILLHGHLQEQHFHVFSFKKKNLEFFKMDVPHLVAGISSSISINLKEIRQV